MMLVLFSTLFLLLFQAAEALTLAQEAVASEMRLQQELEALRRSRVTPRQLEHLRANLRLEYLAQLDLTCEMEAEARTFRRQYLDCEEARKALEAGCARATAEVARLRADAMSLQALMREKEEDWKSSGVESMKKRRQGCAEATAV